MNIYEVAETKVRAAKHDFLNPDYTMRDVAVHIAGGEDIEDIEHMLAEGTKARYVRSRCYSLANLALDAIRAKTR